MPVLPYLGEGVREEGRKVEKMSESTGAREHGSTGARGRRVGDSDS